MSVPTPEQIAWAGGLFEGEGCITSIRKEIACGHKHLHVRLTLNMTDRDVVERFISIVEFGKIRVKTFEEKKDSYIWECNRHDEVVRIAFMLAPWLGTRRRLKFSELMFEYSESRNHEC